MDSMRHLSTSLPNTSRRRNEPDLLSAFKSAALSVTNLYKAAASESTQAKEAGYQDALDDLLAFLDKDNIGLDDGEGWRVRKWILERLEDTPARHTHSEDDEEIKTEDVETRCSSPETQRKTTPPVVEMTTQEKRPASEPPTIPAITVPSLEEFSFRASAQLPSNHEREQAMEMDPATPSTIRITSRSNRSRRRDARSSVTPSVNFTLQPGTNGKRKFPYGDFFDIGNLNFDTDKKDGGRGGKRSRFV